MLNNVNLCGRLTTDLELKQTPSGKAVTTFTLAVERDFQNNGEKESDFIHPNRIYIRDSCSLLYGEQRVHQFLL